MTLPGERRYVIRDLLRSRGWGRALSGRALPIAAAILILAGGTAYVLLRDHRDPKVEVSSQSKRVQRFTPTDAQWATLTVEPVARQVFRS